ncbi:hypothetical protein [Streptomyces sp. NPDC020298]|uniref:hypothetical protein n=1 Tax=unclassified Streptomyces TaxID=2593676 RepID=UPI0033CB8013
MVDGTARSGCAALASRDEALQRLRTVADAVLYEGYLLYPYRRSSPKNRVRWQFGVLTPREWAEADGPVPPGVSGSVDSWYQQTECLLRASGDARLRVTVRYLQLQRKQVEQSTGDGLHRPVESLQTGADVHLTFDEAVPREAEIDVPLARLLQGPHRTTVGSPGGAGTEQLGGGAGRVVRRRDPVHAVTTVRAERIRDDGDGHGTALYRLRVRTENTGSLPGGAGVPRAEALRHALMATHTLICGAGVEFGSLIEPPEADEEHARGCRNLFAFPVLGGEPGRGDAVLSSPIILPDHPQVAPESPGDLHDAAEIDEILSLRTLLLTDDEKREARATDPRAADILDRVENMPPEMFARLHGAIRSLQPATRTPTAAARPSAAPARSDTAHHGVPPAGTPEPDAGRPDLASTGPTPAGPARSSTAPTTTAAARPSAGPACSGTAHHGIAPAGTPEPDAGRPAPAGPARSSTAATGPAAGAGVPGGEDPFGAVPVAAGARGVVPWWQEGGDEGLSPTTDSVLVDGVPVAAGSAVRLRPAGRGADAQDMFLAGRTARVAAVFHDVDGSTHLAVTLDDDPAAELNAWYGRYFYFRPHELQPLTATVDEGAPDGRP